MENGRIEILKDCRYYLERLQICNIIRPHIGSLPIPNIMINIAFLFPMFVTTVCLMRYIILMNFNLNAVSNSFAITMGCTQLTFIYMSLAINRRLIYETMDRMQFIVDYRKLYINFA